jgi:hypothetical protein
MTKQIVQKRQPRKAPGSRVEFTMQSVRLAKGDNKKMKAEAKRQGKSFNLWAVDVLTKALRLAERKRQSPDGPIHEAMRQATKREGLNA